MSKAYARAQQIGQVNLLMSIFENGILKEAIREQVILYAFLLYTEYKSNVKVRIFSTKKESYEEYVDLATAKRIAEDGIRILDSFNSDLQEVELGRKKLNDLASPSTNNCNYCHFRFRCDKYWLYNAPSLPDGKYFHVRGKINRILHKDSSSITAEFNVIAGNVPYNSVIIRNFESIIDLKRDSIFRIINIKKEFLDQDSNIFKYFNLSQLWIE